MKLVDEHEAGTILHAEIERSGSTRLAVAFWGDGATERLGIDLKAKAVSVVCNLRMGGTNPSEIRKLMSLGVVVLQSDALHGKVYLFDGSVMIGSSNASSNGLSFQEGEGRTWREANVFSHDAALRAEAGRWIDRLSTEEITEDDLTLAEEAWSRRRTSINGGAGSLIERMRSSPSYFDGKNVFLTLYADDMDDEGLAGVEAAQAEFGDELDAFQGWPELPVTGTLICFRVGARGGLTFESFYERRASPRDRVLPSGSTLELCWISNDVFGMGLPPSDLKHWKMIFRSLEREGRWDRQSARAVVVNLSEVARHHMAGIAAA